MNELERERGRQKMEMGSSSSSSSSTSNSPDSLNGLKFGRKIYFEDMGFSVPARSGGGSPPLSAAGGTPARKGRSGGGGPPRCQVEGCRVDLSDAKTYYSRHKLCVMHSKSPKVTVNGLEQRFCQQCSRFHQLAEFDQGKRSCRRRLAGHNERRRKPPPGSLFSSHYLRLSSSIFVKGRSSQTGSYLMDFKDPPPDLFMQVSAGGTRSPGAGNPSGEYLMEVSSDVAGVSSDSGCALSLLSNQPHGFKNRPFSLNAEGALINRQTLPPGAALSQFSSTPWSFKVSEASDGSRDMGLDLGPSQISQYYNGEFEVGPQSERKYMELQHSSAYDSSAQHMNWSL